MSALNGTKHHNSKLTADQVRSMREEYIPYVNGYKKLGEKYGVDFSTVRDCVQYYSYKNVYWGVDMWKCKKCGEYKFPNKFSNVGVCHCKVFKIIDRDGDDHDVYAIDATGAALKFAEKSNENGDYYLMGESAVIDVDGRKFRISAEPDIYYSADIVE